MSTRSCSRTLWLGALLLAVAAGCSPIRESVAIHSARTAVTRFNEAAVEAYHSGRTDGLARVATSSGSAWVQAVIDGLAARGQFMVARPLELRVESARLVKPDLVEVETVETWSYEHRSRARPDEPAPARTVTYTMAYQVQRREAGWLVSVAVERPPR